MLVLRSRTIRRAAVVAILLVSRFRVNESTNKDETVDSDVASGRQKWLGRILIAIATVLWSSSGFFAKAPIFEDWPVEVRGDLLVFWRALFASLVLVFLVRKPCWDWRLVPSIIAFATMNWAFLGALVHTEATVAIWLQYTSPVWVFLGSWLVFRETPKPRDWTVLAFAVGGVTLILFWNASFSPRGITLGLISGLCFGSVVLSLRWMRDIDAGWIIFLFHAVTAVLFAPIVWRSNLLPSGQQWFYLLCFGAIQMGIPYVLFARGVQRITSHEASGLSLLEPILVPVWVFVAWRQHPDYQAPELATLIGGGLILMGLILRYFRTQPQDEA